MVMTVGRHLADRATGRPGGRGPRTTVLCVLLIAGLGVAGCSSPALVRPPAAPVPDVMEPAWLQAGLLDVSFTATHHDEATGLRISRIQTVFALGPGGRVLTMQTAQSSNGIVTSHTTWRGGTTIESAQLPSCIAAATQVPVPASLGGWLAEAFGPVDKATGAGWSISGLTASRPGSTGDTVEQAQLTRLPERVTREVNSTTGTVVSEVTNIEIHRVDTVEPTTDLLPSCGQQSHLTPEPAGEGPAA